MSRHEGVSCDFCNKSNFKGKRYKCLVCFDYDLCARCHENGIHTPRHTTEHPMQCILTRADFDLFYGGETIPFDQPQSYTCPFCCKVGISEAALKDHVGNEHASNTKEVICPVCAALPGGDPNHLTDDLGGHLTLEHRSPLEMDAPLSGRNIRRMFHHARSSASPRGRRTNVFPSSSTTSNTTSATFSSSRESVDPIADLLSQLSGVRRATLQQQQQSSPASSTTAQLQLLQQQLQFERQQVQQARERLERLPRKPASNLTPTSASGTVTTSSRERQSQHSFDPRYLLAGCFDEHLPAQPREAKDEASLEREHFAQDLFYTMFSAEQQAGLAKLSLCTPDLQVPIQSNAVDHDEDDLESDDFANPVIIMTDDDTLQNLPGHRNAELNSNEILLLKPVPRDNNDEASVTS